MMLLWDGLLLRSKGSGNAACLSALLLTGSSTGSHVRICMCVSAYVCMRSPGLLNAPGPLRAC